MKKIRGLITGLIIGSMILGMSSPAYGFSENESRSVENFFIEANMLKGNGSEYGLDALPTRMEGTIILIRILGKESEAQALASEPCPFTDVPDWAVGYANYAYNSGITKGISETLFGTYEPMTAQQYNTLLLRTVGYDDNQGDFNWDSAVETAGEEEILPTDMVDWYESQSNEYTKRDLLESSFCYLEVSMHDDETANSLIDQLIENGIVSRALADKYGVAVQEVHSFVTNLSEDDYFDLTVQDNNTIQVTGSSNDTNKKWILIQVENVETEREVTTRYFEKNSNNQYNYSFSTTLPMGEYYLNFYGNSEKYHTYTSIFLNSLKIKVSKEGVSFLSAPTYGQNLRIYLGNEVNHEDEIMTLTTRATKDVDELMITTAEEITIGCSSDYERIKAIHDWVSENIYYDKDYLDGTTQNTNINAYSVLKNKYAVCSGYANLTKDLISALGIPCKEVIGFALGYGDEKRWEDVDLFNVVPNHVWNEAYVDGRWVIIDTTWDSQNRYSEGVFTTGNGSSSLYFDVSMPFFSLTHKSTPIETL